MYSRVLRKFRQAARRRSYTISYPHFVDKLELEGLSLQDVEFAILTGSVVRKEVHHPSGTRHVIRGKAHDRRTMEIVGCIQPTGAVVLITVFVVESNEDDYGEQE